MTDIRFNCISVTLIMSTSGISGIDLNLTDIVESLSPRSASFPETPFSAAPRDAAPVRSSLQSRGGCLSALPALLSNVGKRGRKLKGTYLQRSIRSCDSSTSQPNRSNLAAAAFARQRANDAASADYRILSARTCWDAVKYCALKSGVIDRRTHNRLSAYQDLITNSNSQIRSAEEMRCLPPGHVIGFFKHASPVSIHAMISTGEGMAAGNKNDCIGVGNFVGWEELDLAHGLRWTPSGEVIGPLGIDEEGGQASQLLTLRHRPLESVRNRSESSPPRENHDARGAQRAFWRAVNR
jgi:hypothetical protein